MKIRRMYSVFAIIAVLAFTGVYAWGQGFTATVLGTITDTSGASVPGATITVTNLATQVKNSVLSDSSGKFTAPLLPPGNYSVVVEMKGFKRAAQNSVTLDVAAQVRADFKLEVGQSSETVTVSAEAAQLQTEEATVGAAVTTQQMSELPLNGRLSLQLDLLLPGAQSTVKGHLAGEGGSIFVHGLREDQNYFWLDGMDNFSQGVGTYVVNMPQFSISEFRVMSPTYDSQFGRTPGAQINVITRSGANDFHGDIYELFRNNALDAKNFFDPAGHIPVFRRDQFGADIGGRIKRDKTFFYGAWEGIRQAQAESASNTVPTTAEVQGNFSALSTVIRDPSSVSCTSTGAFVLANCTPFAGNIVPSNRINSIGAAIAAVYPAPNSGTNGLLVAPTGTLHDDVSLLKIDQILGPNDRATARMAFETENANEPIAQFGSLTNIPGMGLIIHGQHDYTGGLSETHIFSPSLVGEFRYGWNRYEYNYLQGDYTNNFDGKTGLGQPLVQINPVDWGMPSVSLGGAFSALGSQQPELGPFDTWFVAPTFTIVKGRHTVKAGIDFHRSALDFFISSNARGTFSFTGAYSGNPLSDLLLGLPATASVGVRVNEDRQQLFRSNEWSGFVQDEWKLTPRLTLTLGMRYEYLLPATDARDHLSNYIPNPSTHTLTQILAGQNGHGSSVYNADPDEYEPRVGFAWDVFGNGKWAVRGGYGIFRSLTLLNQTAGIWNNYPQLQTWSVIGNGQTINLNNVFFNAQAAIPNATAWPQNYTNGLVHQYSLGVQHQVMKNTILDVGGVGTTGHNLDSSQNLNVPAPGPGTVQTRRPYQGWTNVTCSVCPVSHSQYYGLETRLERRMSNGLSFQASFTWSHAFDNYSGSGTATGYENPNNPNADWGPSNFDVRTRLVLSGLYELPVGNGKQFLNHMNKAGDLILGGWQLNTIMTFHSGYPFNVVLTTDNSNTGVNADRPNVIGNPYQSTASCQTGTPQCWVNPAAFALPAQYTYGNLGRNALRGPGFEDIDISLFKTFAIRERTKITFRGELFNVLNHPPLDNPGTTGTTDPWSPTTTTFGQIYTAGGGGVGIYSSRQVQLGLRVIF